jgi:teichuronic acid biosynthesis glycosyltransferase TuaC
MKVLVFTHMYPTYENPAWGVFVQQQVESLKREGVHVEVLHVDTTKSKWLYPWSFVPLIHHAYREKYDLIHAHYVFAGLVARSQFRYPVVVTHHGEEAFFGWQVPLCRLVSRLVDKTIAVSSQIKAAINIPDISVIPCGVDFNLFKPMDHSYARSALGLPPEKKLVLFVGNCTERLKRTDLIEGAVSVLRSRDENVDLVIAHKKPYQTIPLYMNACDVLVLASEREGSPQVIKEAMACNLPIVAADVGDVKDVISSADNCYLCIRDVSDIAEKISIVLNSPRRTNGRELARKYELSAIAKKIIDVYKEVAK